MMSCIQHTRLELQDLGDRVDHFERSMSDFTDNYNTLVDAHTAQSKDISWIKEKLSDIEDRSRRNNLKIRGVPESQLPHFAHELFLALIPYLIPTNVTIDRIHSIPRLSFLPQEVPRDVILRIHFFQVKEELIAAFRRPERYLNKQENFNYSLISPNSPHKDARTSFPSPRN